MQRPGKFQARAVLPDARRGRSSGAEGFSLMDMMLALALVGLLSVILLPLMSGYVAHAREALMVRNMETLSLLQADHFLERGSYVTGVYDPADPDALRDLGQLGWDPGVQQQVRYVVALEAGGWSVTATDGKNGTSITRRYP